MIESYLSLINKEQEKLPELFSKYLPKDYCPKRILNFCCGIANEESILKDLYGTKLEMISFDNSEFMEQAAKELGRKSFLRYDIKKAKEFMRGKYDLIIGRNIPINPNSDNNNSNEVYDDPWPNFLMNIKNRIHENSYLFMSLAREDEFNRAKQILTELKFGIKIQEKNKILIPSDRIGVAGADVKDNYVLLAKQSN